MRFQSNALPRFQDRLLPGLPPFRPPRLYHARLMLPSVVLVVRSKGHLPIIFQQDPGRTKPMVVLQGKNRLFSQLSAQGSSWQPRGPFLHPIRRGIAALWYFHCILSNDQPADWEVMRLRRSCQSQSWQCRQIARTRSNGG
jgi:hypothetical protein